MKTETFSYLPPLTPEQARRQIAYGLNNGWIVGVEFTSQPGPTNTYWSWWKLPFFNARTPEEVWNEVEACAEAHPDCFVRITAYDNREQRQMMSFVVHHPG
jgi:ribulose-bisphosphate carboxylase small chain